VFIPEDFTQRTLRKRRAQRREEGVFVRGLCVDFTIR